MGVVVRTAALCVLAAGRLAPGPSYPGPACRCVAWVQGGDVMGDSPDAGTDAHPLLHELGHNLVRACRTSFLVSFVALLKPASCQASQSAEEHPAPLGPLFSLLKLAVPKGYQGPWCSPAFGGTLPRSSRNARCVGQPPAWRSSDCGLAGSCRFLCPS